MQLQIIRGDITEQHVDVIVNAANSSLLGGGGVDGAIHAKGGPTILAACRELRAGDYPNGLPAGQAVATTAGKLPARWVIHTVGPVFGRGDVSQLRSCYERSLVLVGELGAQSVAFPLISAGAYGWPAEDAVRQAADVISASAVPATARLVLFSRSLMACAQRVVGPSGSTS